MFADSWEEAREIFLNRDRSAPRRLVSSLEQAREVVAELGNIRCVVVDVPSIDSLRHCRSVLRPLLQMVKDRSWFVDSAYMLYRADELAESLSSLYDNAISSLLDVLEDAIVYYLDLKREEDEEVDPFAGPPQEILFPPLPVAEATAAAAASALLAVMDGIDKDPAEAAKAKAALLHALHGLGDGEQRAADLRRTLNEMRRTVNINCYLSSHSSNHLVCRDLALCCTRLTGATGMLTGADDTPYVLPELSPDEIAARVDCLKRLISLDLHAISYSMHLCLLTTPAGNVTRPRWRDSSVMALV